MTANVICHAPSASTVVPEQYALPRRRFPVGAQNVGGVRSSAAAVAAVATYTERLR